MLEKNDNIFEENERKSRGYHTPGRGYTSHRVLEKNIYFLFPTLLLKNKPL